MRGIGYGKEISKNYVRFTSNNIDTIIIKFIQIRGIRLWKK